ncbi:hypothetical protein CALVIDRAFT_599208 [Calocera viscosa TUFC12733]|uniref:separase n=1 Tax=Calocera viscosa (strain TUFC12733) TaxID=1330018 RepID=A0A167L7Y0_CALVF|nr:hypothetical protein CALVIDRAFT_599208 [Calocera viscosa TUFC12733]
MPVPARATRSASSTQTTTSRNRTVSGKVPKTANASSRGADEVDALASRMTTTLRLKDNVASSTASRAGKTTALTTRATHIPSKLTAENVPTIAKDELSPAEKGRQAMRTVNSAMQSLAEAVQKGWKASQSNSKPAATIRARSVNKQEGVAEGEHTFESITSTASKCRAALATMRGMSGRADIKPIDVERAAVNVAGKLVGLEMWTLVLDILAESRPSILQLYEYVPSPAKDSLPAKTAIGVSKTGGRQRVPSSRSTTKESHGPFQHFELLRYPLPINADNADGAVLNAIASSQLYALTSLVRLVDSSSIRQLSPALSAPGNLLDFVPVLQSRLGSKFYSTLALSTFRAIATSLSSSDAHPPDVLFSIRAWSLRCFIRADGVSGDDFWDQTMRWAASYLKGIPSGSQDEEKQASDKIMALFTELVNIAGERQDRRTFANGAVFGKMCDWWISLARRTGNLETINVVSNMLASTSTVSMESTSSLSRGLETPGRRRTKKDDAGMSLSRTYARLSQAEAFVHKLVTEGEDKGTATRLGDVMSDIIQLPRLYQSGADGIRRVQREAERLRHSCVKLLEKSVETNLACQALRPACIAVLEGLVDVAESIISADKGNSTGMQLSNEFCADLSTGSLDSLLMMSRLVLSPSQHATHNLAYAYLERASKIAMTAAPADAAKYLRCLAAAYQNAAALMYKHNKAEYATRFAEQAFLNSKLLFDVSSGVAENELNSLREQTGRRAEILASCYLKQGDRKMAYRAYCDALSWVPNEEVAALQTSLTEQSVQASFESRHAVSALIDRITRLAVTDLLLPPTEISLRAQLEDRGMPQEIIGGLLEYQVLTMDSMLHKPECITAVGSLLEDLLDLYVQNVFPIRRSRVLLRKLEHQYYTGADAPSSLASDILEGFVGEDKGKDASLAAFIPQYQALTHVWLAMQSHANADEPNMPAIMQHTNEAVRILRQVYARGAMRESEGSAPLKNHRPGTRQAKPGIPQTPRTPRGRRAVSNKTSRTLVSSSESVDTSATAACNKPIAVDNVERLYKHLELLSDLLNFLSLPLQRVDVLEILRHLHDYRSPSTVSCDGMLRTTTDLAYEHARLGKTGRASRLYAQAVIWSTHKHCDNPVSETAKIFYLLRYAGSLASHGNLEKSSSLYQEALDLALGLEADESQSTAGRIKARTLLIERAALAASVYASIKDEEDDLPTALNALEQSLRLWNRAMENVTRLNPSLPQQPLEDASNPFLDDDTTVKQSTSKSAKHSYVALDGLQWRVAEGLYQTLLLLAKNSCQSGSPRAGLLYFQRAAEVAESLKAPLPWGTALALQEELRIMCEDAGSEDGLARATELLGNLRTSGMIEILRIQGEHYVKEEDKVHAHEVYASADGVLKDLETTYSHAVATQQTPLKLSRKRADEKPGADTALDALLPVLQAALLRQQVWLLKEPSDTEEFEELLTRLLSLPPTRDLKAEENSLLGRVHLHDACNQFRNDLFLSSLTESIIAVPMGMTSGHSMVPSASSTQVLDTLHKAEQYFAEALELMLCKGRVSQTRRISVSLALIHAFQTTLGKVNSRGPRLAASLLEMSSGTSLHRQVLESIDLKLRPTKHLNDLEWSTIVPNRNVGEKRPALPQDPDLQDEDDDSADEDDQRSDTIYWRSTRERYQTLLSDVGVQGPAQVDMLPANWTVISINVTEDQSTMLIARHRPQREPLILCLPLDRQGKREGEDDQFTFQSALEELDDIIESSNQGISAAKEVAGKDATASWWSERSELDRRLGELLETMEFCWLGAFKTIMCEPPRATKDSLKALRYRLEKIFQGVVGSHDRNTPVAWTRLDDNILECFASLTSKCRDEELEDLVYFVLDLYHFHGVPVALAEIDVDMLVMDIRTALEEFAVNPPLLSSSQVDPHLFLVLDKNVQGIPWESMPILRSRSVSRIPSISFLVDRIELSRQRLNAQHGSTSSQESIDRATVDPRRTFYMLNVSQDLTRTEQQFSPWLKEMDQIGWRGIIGRPPMEGEMLRALESSELVLYFGHGGGEQYVRSQQIRALSRCAAVMLWGCSSGALRKMGEFDRFGTPHNYMLAGCPNVVATLWDVTDRDIDRFSDSVFKKMRLDRTHVEAWTATRPSGTSVVAAVAQSRDVCKLKYLNGAAPVVYGIPYYL